MSAGGQHHAGVCGVVGDGVEHAQPALDVPTKQVHRPLSILRGPLPDGTRKSVGVILPSTLTFNTAAP
jgi:hypothetical protein